VNQNDLKELPVCPVAVVIKTLKILDGH
jgi:hypothetical protein